MRIIADLHTHSTYSHGRGTVEDNVMVALGRGLQAVAITDHGPRSAPWVAARVTSFSQLRQDIAGLNRKVVGIQVLAGAECNIISALGELDLPSEIRDELDIVLAGLHPGILPRSAGDWAVLSGANWAARVSRHWRKRARLQNTRAVVEAVFRNDIDIITHPGYHLDIDTVELARACALRNTALEINARHDEMTPAFCRAAAREGVKFVINSDAHRAEDVGRLSRGVAVAQAAGLESELVLNSEAGGLFDWLREKQAQRRSGRSYWSDWAEQPGTDRARGEKRAERNRGGTSVWKDWSQQGPIH